MYRKYFVYIDDGQNLYKIAIAAACEESAMIQCSGLGDIVSVADVSEEYVIKTERVLDALKNADFKKCEIEWISRLLCEFGVTE